MRPFGFTVSLVATLAIAAVVVNCSSDNSAANDPLLAPDGGAAQLGNMSFMNGGGWSPTVEAASNDKVSVCHSGNGKHWVQLSLSAQGARAHLGDPSSVLSTGPRTTCRTVCTARSVIPPTYSSACSIFSPRR